jgi:hypothetical protein
MENSAIINFSNFFEGEPTPKLGDVKFDLKDFFINEESSESVEKPKSPKKPKIEKPVIQEPFNPPVESEDFIIDEEEPEKLDFEKFLPEPNYEIEENFSPEPSYLSEESSVGDSFYPVYKDKSENFSCDVMVEGASISDTKARLILESDDWTLMFEGDIDRSGKCNIPIRKLNILEEGVVGKIKLEVIADNTVFVPWEDDFKVKMSKKVTVQLSENKNSRRENLIRESNVKVRVR